MESPDGQGEWTFTIMRSSRHVVLSSLPHPLGQLPSFLSILADSCQSRWEICLSNDSQPRANPGIQGKATSYRQNYNPWGCNLSRGRV